MVGHTNTLALCFAVLVVFIQSTHATGVTGGYTVATTEVKSKGNAAAPVRASANVGGPSPAPDMIAAPAAPATPLVLASVPAQAPSTMITTPPSSASAPNVDNPYESASLAAPVGSPTPAPPPVAVRPPPADASPSAPAIPTSPRGATLLMPTPTSPTPAATVSTPATVFATAPASDPTPSVAATLAAPSSQDINVVANIDPTKRGVAKSVVKTTSGDAKIKAKAEVINTKRGTITKVKVKVKGELPEGVALNAIAGSGNVTQAKSSVGVVPPQNR